MPSLPRTVARVLLVAVSLALATAGVAQGQGAGIEVTVKPPSGAAQSIVTTDIAGDINTSYKIQKGGGGIERVTVVKGVSLRQILAETSTNFSYQTIEVPRPDGSTLTITKDQIEDPTNQAVFYADESGLTHFIGPREPGAAAVAAANYFAVTGPILLTQQTESKLKVTISPKSKKVPLGGSATFRATVEGNDDGDALTFTWGINGKKQTHTTSSSFKQTFPSKDGVVEFLVAVRIAGSGVSTTDVAKVTVGNPEKAKREQVGNGTTTDGSNGGTGTGTGTGLYDSDTTYTPDYTPSTPSITPVPPSTPSTPPPDVPDIATSGTTVEGNLLADVSDPPPSSILESAARAAREGKQKSDDSAADGANVSEAALSIVGVLALLALGAGIETRQGRLPRWRPPRLRRGA